MPMPISAAPATRNRTPLSVTVAMVAASEKNSAATAEHDQQHAESGDRGPFRPQALDRLAETMRGDAAFDAFDIARSPGERRWAASAGA